jgi:RHS repeat-associated protein
VTSESNSPNGDRYAYTGRERDVETGLQYNRARYYDPATGRWISQDPLGFDAGDSNLYRYVNNNPTLATDPSGFIPFPAGTVINAYNGNIFVKGIPVIGWQYGGPPSFAMDKGGIVWTSLTYAYSKPVRVPKQAAIKVGDVNLYRYEQLFLVSGFTVNVKRTNETNETNEMIAKTINFAANFVPGKVLMQGGAWVIGNELQQQLTKISQQMKVTISTYNSKWQVAYSVSYWGTDEGRPAHLVKGLMLPKGQQLGYVTFPLDKKKYYFASNEEAVKILAGKQRLFLGIGLEQ